MKKDWQPNYGWAVLAGALAWVIPGAGHILLRRTVRGIIIFVCVTGLFWTGMGIGGAFTVDPIRERWWYAAQMLTGASGFIGLNQQERAVAAVEQNARTIRQEQERAAAETARRTGDASKAQFLVEDWNAICQREAVAQKVWLAPPTDGVARAYSGIAGMLNIMCIFDAFMLGLVGKKGEGPLLKSEDGEAPGDEEAKK